MLHITRRINEDVVIELPDGQLIEILVSKMGGTQICLSIKTDDDIKVYRGEVYDRIQKEQQGVKS